MNRPFLKWAGGKHRLCQHIKKFLPKAKRLIEPFAGSAAVFLNTDYPYNLIADSNADLIQLYKILQEEGPDFIRYCQNFFVPENNNAETFYIFRESFNQTKDLRLRAALFIYLNRHGFNGLCRYNSSGKFNVPFGRYKKISLPEQAMLSFYKKSQNAQFIHADFLKTLQSAQEGDVIYCDPPYMPLSKSSHFTHYAQNDFNAHHQNELATAAMECAKRGICVVISNHDNQATRKLYYQAEITSLLVKRFISSNAHQRPKVKELIAVFR